MEIVRGRYRTPAPSAPIFRFEMKILIAEDEPALRVIMEDLFLSGDHEVRAVYSGLGALGFIRSWGPDVLVADLDLPGAAGEGLAKAAAALPRPARIVLMSADAERLERARGLADAVLHKPFPMTALLSLVDPLPPRSVHPEEKR